MSQQQSTDTIRSATYRQTPYRYVNFAIYMAAALVNSLPTQTFASINKLVADNFSYDPILVTLNILIFPVLHPVCAFPVNWILDKFGMKIGCCIGGSLLVAGVWMRTLIQENNIFWCLAGSTLASIGNVFILNSPSILATNWFKPTSIPAIISFAVLANLISMTLGAGIPGLTLIKTNEGKKDYQIRQSVQGFLRIQAIVITIPIIIMFLGLRSKPEIPPSKAAVQNEKIKQDYAQSMKKLFKNTQYLKIMVSMALSYGTITSYLANLDQTLASISYQQSGKIAALIVLAAMFSGLLSSFFFIRKVKTTLQYKYIINICLLSTFIMYTLLQFVILLKPDDWALIILAGCTGFFNIPTTSLFMSYSSEVVFPLGEGSATGYLFAASQTFGFVAGLGSAALVSSSKQNVMFRQNQETPLWKIYLFMGLHALFLLGSFLLSLPLRNILNRTKYQLARLSRSIKGQKQTEQGLIYSAV